MLYYQESLDVTENIKLFPAELDTLEAIWVEFKLHSQRLLLSVMYRSQKHVDFYETLDKQLEYIWEKRKNIHIIGDLNSDLLLKGKSEGETTYGRKLLNVLRNYGLVNVIKQPTRVTASTNSLIDLSIVSEKEKVLKSGVFETGIADHRLDYSILKLSKTRCPPVTKEIIDWKKCNVRNFKEEIGLVPWHSCQAFDDVDDNYWMVEKLHEQIKTEQLPKRKAKVRMKSLPYVNSKIRKLMNQRYKQLIKAQKSKDPEDWKMHKELRNKVSREMKRAERNYWVKLLSEKENNKKDF